MLTGVVPFLRGAGAKNLSLKEESIAIAVDDDLPGEGLVASAPREVNNSPLNPTIFTSTAK